MLMVDGMRDRTPARLLQYHVRTSSNKVSSHGRGVIMPKSVYQDIYQDLKGRIECGDIAYGAFLPSENELTGRYSCSRSSVRRALAELASDGYVQSQQGKGVRVIRDPTLDVSRGYDGLETFNEMAARLNFTPTTRCLVLEDLTADEDLARLTGFPAGSELTHVLRVRIADGKALSTDESYYLSSVVEGLTPPIVEGGIYRFLEGERRIKIATSRRIITVEGVTEQDERCIDLDGFNAVSVMRSHTFDLEGIMVEYTETRQRPETFSQYSTTIRTR